MSNVHDSWIRTYRTLDIISITVLYTNPDYSTGETCYYDFLVPSGDSHFWSDLACGFLSMNQAEFVLSTRKERIGIIGEELKEGFPPPIRESTSRCSYRMTLMIAHGFIRLSIKFKAACEVQTLRYFYESQDAPGYTRSG